jgi:hypothetical protein
MGHDLPRALIPRFITHIVDHLRRADAASQGRHAVKDDRPARG